MSYLAIAARRQFFCKNYFPPLEYFQVSDFTEPVLPTVTVIVRICASVQYVVRQNTHHRIIMRSYLRFKSRDFLLFFDILPHISVIVYSFNHILLFCKYVNNRFQPDATTFIFLYYTCSRKAFFNVRTYLTPMYLL